MTKLEDLSFYHVETDADFTESVVSYQRGPPPASRVIAAQLPSVSDTSTEVYWLSFEPIRPAGYMTCGWPR